ncbi:uncharacterized protein EI90DRAFT_2456883 [Cantharellus anzutake]|uniref:uncharacterized protein n=1 Tax=Cantharellus anzutake TaxID=1750568 RepID=UPI00190507A4|nr:uncharacterized protein EI90DRAFT_2456883 [Cantharellus anzutake]KAF8339090.1 hypothetical protein EI90DRAFT_2456883 [Cantharellus anzutake]
MAFRRCPPLRPHCSGNGCICRLQFNKSITVFGETLKSSVPASNSLGVAVSVITFATLGPLLGISLARQGAAISMVVVELSVVFVLWVLWLTVGGYTASQWSGCDSLGLDSAVSTPCGCSRAAAAFGFLSFFAQATPTSGQRL